MNETKTTSVLSILRKPIPMPVVTIYSFIGFVALLIGSTSAASRCFAIAIIAGVFTLVIRACRKRLCAQ